MADRIEPFQVTVPAGTQIAAPQVTALTFNDGIVDFADIVVPPGPSGLVGFQLLHRGQSVIPYKGATFFVWDGQYRRWPLENFPTAAGWQLRAYNLDVFAHTIYIDFGVREIPVGAARYPAPIAID